MPTRRRDVPAASSVVSARRLPSGEVERGHGASIPCEGAPRRASRIARLYAAHRVAAAGSARAAARPPRPTCRPRPRQAARASALMRSSSMLAPRRRRWTASQVMGGKLCGGDRASPPPPAAAQQQPRTSQLAKHAQGGTSQDFSQRGRTRKGPRGQQERAQRHETREFCDASSSSSRLTSRLRLGGSTPRRVVARPSRSLVDSSRLTPQKLFGARPPRLCARRHGGARIRHAAATGIGLAGFSDRRLMAACGSSARACSAAAPARVRPPPPRLPRLRPPAAPGTQRAASVRARRRRSPRPQLQSASRRTELRIPSQRQHGRHFEALEHDRHGGASAGIAVVASLPIWDEVRSDAAGLARPRARRRGRGAGPCATGSGSTPRAHREHLTPACPAAAVDAVGVVAQQRSTAGRASSRSAGPPSRPVDSRHRSPSARACTPPAQSRSAARGRRRRANSTHWPQLEARRAEDCRPRRRHRRQPSLRGAVFVGAEQKRVVVDRARSRRRTARLRRSRAMAERFPRPARTRALRSRSRARSATPASERDRRRARRASRWCWRRGIGGGTGAADGEG